MTRATPIAESQVERKARLRDLMAELDLSQGQTAVYLSIVCGDVISPQTVRRWIALRPEGASSEAHFSRECPGWPVLLLELAVAGDHPRNRVLKEAMELVRRQTTVSGITADRELLAALRGELVGEVASSAPRRRGRG
jgi:hypothetical protein